MEHAEKIVEAVKRRDAAEVERLLERDPGLIRVQTPAGSLLMMAAYYGARDIVRLIRDRQDDLTVFEAAAVGDADRLRELLPGAPELARQHNDHGMTPLHLASFFGYKEAAEVLLNGGADINAMSLYEQPNIPRNTALHAALAGRAWDVAELLLAGGADVHAVDSAGLTPLHHAAAAGSRAMVERILARGARPDVRDRDGHTPLQKAEQLGHSDVVKILAARDGSIRL